MNVNKTPVLTVWTDGACQLCQTSRKWCELRDRNARIRFVDFRIIGDEALPLPREDHEATIWVRDDNGALLAGFAAWQRVMSELPGWRWLALLAAAPPFTAIGPPLYRFIATLRHHFPGNQGLTNRAPGPRGS